MQRNNSAKVDYAKDLVEYIALSLVDDPSSVQVSQERNGGRVRLELHVAKEDMLHQVKEVDQEDWKTSPPFCNEAWRTRFMTDLDFLKLSKPAKIGYNFLGFLKRIPMGIVRGVQKLFLAIWHVICLFGSNVKDVVLTFVNGDWKTRLSFLIM